VSPERHRLAYRRLIEAGFNRGDPATLSELLATGFIVHGHDITRAVVADSRSAFPDLRLSVIDQVAEADLVASRWVARGTHGGVLLGIAPTRRSVAVTGMSLVRFVDGQIVEEWLEVDVAGLLQQLGRWPLEPFATEI
jgi:predicted ester cyclase